MKYRPDREQILFMWRAGVHPIEIAERMSRTHAAVKGVIKRSKQRRVRFSVAGEVFETFAAEARARGVRPFDLIESVLTITAKDMLFDAVLGTPEEMQGAA